MSEQSASSNRIRMLWGGGLLVLIAAAMWMLIRTSEPSALETPDPSPTSHGASTGSASLSAPTDGSDRSAARRSESNSAGATETDAATGELSGFMLFADGSAPPEVRFDVAIDPCEPTASNNDCRRGTSARTDANGYFEINHLCAGQYRIHVTCFVPYDGEVLPGMQCVDPLLRVPTRDARVVLGGYQFRIRTVSPDVEARMSSITLEYQPDHSDPASGIERRVFRGLSKFGRPATLCVPGPGTCVLRAEEYMRYSRALSMAVTGPSRTISAELRLDQQYVGSSLRVKIQGCPPSSLPIPAYCIHLHDNDRGFEGGFNSDEMEDDGLFHRLLPGNYLASVVSLHFDPPDFCLPAMPSEVVPLVLVDGQESQMEICARLGGRLSVLVTGEAADSSSLKSANIRATLAGMRGAAPVALSFRHTEEGMVRATFPFVPLGTRVFSDSVIEPGEYYLSLEADGWTAPVQLVTIRPGEMTEVSIAMHRSK